MAGPGLNTTYKADGVQFDDRLNTTLTLGTMKIWRVLVDRRSVKRERARVRLGIREAATVC